MQNNWILIFFFNALISSFSLWEDSEIYLVCHVFQEQSHAYAYTHTLLYLQEHRCACPTAYVWRLEDNIQGLALSFHHRIKFKSSGVAASPFTL